MRAFQVFMFILFDFLKKIKLLGSLFNLAEHLVFKSQVSKSLHRKITFLSLRKLVFGNSLSAAGWKGSTVGVLSAS